jgi:hypothetical protein
VAGLRRRLAALIEENGALKDCAKMWKERALCRRLGRSGLTEPAFPLPVFGGGVAVIRDKGVKSRCVT